MLNKLTSRERKILYVVVGLLFLVLGYHGVWSPLKNKFSDLDDEVFSLELRLRKAKVYLRQKGEIFEESKKYPNLEQMDARSDEEEISSLMNFIAETARRAGVSLPDLKPQQVKSDKMTKQYIVEISAESELSKLIEFTYELQNSPELLKVEQVKTAPREGKSPVLRSSLVVSRVVVK